MKATVPAPSIDLSAIMRFVTSLPAGEVESVARGAWTAARSGHAPAYNMYIVAFCAQRIAEEALLEHRSGVRSSIATPDVC